MLVKILQKVIKIQDKAVVFFRSLWLSELVENVIKDELPQMNAYTFDGNRHHTERQQHLDRFIKDENSAVLLMTMKTGACGLTITCAHHIIMFECDWNPQNTNQAIARCVAGKHVHSLCRIFCFFLLFVVLYFRSHRIGQTEPVHVYRLINEGTLDVYVMDRAMSKLVTAEKYVVYNPHLRKELTKTDAEEQASIKKMKEFTLMIDQDTVCYPSDDVETISEKGERAWKKLWCEHDSQARQKYDVNKPKVIFFFFSIVSFFFCFAIDFS